ncbi:helix-turn-helix transcriptional regulator [Bradyrhizobium mercantei]|uniref:helix-turn-helix transcriptional regulator n=1 Tax=Bradyrhizobium mercantei TaxID=1904807 RepID=UPI001AECB0DE|nr:hypothetical protein [Bradyrhizobium mercantei]
MPNMAQPHDHFDDRLSGLIDHLYDAAIDGRLWAGLAPKIAEAFDSRSAVLKLHNGPDVHLLECTENMMVPDSRRGWAEDWHRRDLWLQRTIPYGLSTIVTDHDLVTPEEQLKSGFYQEWLRELDIFHVVGTAFSAGDDAIGVLGIHRPKGAQPYTRADQHKATIFLPHLRRALQLGRRLSSIGHAAALATLDRLHTGVLVVDQSCRVLHANPMAEGILRVETVVGILSGRLHIRSPVVHEQLIHLVRACIRTAAGRPEQPKTAMAIPRADRLPLTLSAAPLRPTGIFSASTPFALVFLSDPEFPAISTTCLRDLFGLTRTEAAIAADLGRGLSLEQIAARRRIALQTARAHLKQIFVKTDTNRQAELTALVTRSVAAFRPQQPSSSGG